MFKTSKMSYCMLMPITSDTRATDEKQNEKGICFKACHAVNLDATRESAKEFCLQLVKWIRKDTCDENKMINSFDIWFYFFF